MLMDYSSAENPLIVDRISSNEGGMYVSAESNTGDTWSVLIFKSDHPDYELIRKLKSGDKIHYVELPGSWPIEAGGEKYRLKRGWPRGYKEPKSLTKLRANVAKEVEDHQNWCSVDCIKFLPGLYKAQRILEHKSKRSVQQDYASCHRAQ